MLSTEDLKRKFRGDHGSSTRQAGSLDLNNHVLALKDIGQWALDAAAGDVNLPQQRCEVPRTPCARIIQTSASWFAMMDVTCLKCDAVADDISNGCREKRSSRSMG